MIAHWRPIRLLQRAVHLWLFGCLLSTLPIARALWLDPVVEPLPAPPGWSAMLTHVFSGGLAQAAVLPAVLLLMALALRGVVARSVWWITLVEWILFSSLQNAAWPAASGGQQLIANVLFWMVFLPGREPDGAAAARVGVRSIMGTAAFWIIRLQLLVAYGGTGLQKLTGEHWLAGHAVGIVATDPDHGPAWLATWPWLALVVGHGVLLFQLTFPLAVWWRATRRWWMWMGVAFHLATGITFGIVDMGTAFLVVYPIWMRAARPPDKAAPSALAEPEGHF